MSNVEASETSRWDRYAQSHRQDERSFTAEPCQQERAEAIARRVHGTVLDVGSGDPYIAAMMRDGGAEVTLLDISQIRVARARLAGFEAIHADAGALPVEDGSYDCVVLGEVLEHLSDPGRALAEAFRVARHRVVLTVPLGGWCDPTHRWRISLDDCVDPAEDDATKGRQIVMTWAKGACWPPNYVENDPSWAQQFVEGR